VSDGIKITSCILTWTRTSDSRLEPKKPSNIRLVSLEATPLPVIVRPDFDFLSFYFKKALQLYYVNEQYEALETVQYALSKCLPGDAATSSLRALKSIFQLHMPWKTASRTQDVESEAHVEDHIALLFETARVWLSTNDTADVIDTLEQRLIHQLNEILPWVPMPPESGAIVSDLKVGFTYSTWARCSANMIQDICAYPVSFHNDLSKPV
jgi:hypothetical protein